MPIQPMSLLSLASAFGDGPVSLDTLLAAFEPAPMGSPPLLGDPPHAGRLYDALCQALDVPTEGPEGRNKRNVLRAAVGVLCNGVDPRPESPVTLRLRTALRGITEAARDELFAGLSGVGPLVTREEWFAALTGVP